VERLRWTYYPWDERTAPAENALAIVAESLRDLGSIREAKVTPANPPAISGLSLVPGYDYYLREPLSDRALLNRTAATLLDAANNSPGMRNVVIQSAPYRCGLEYVYDADRLSAGRGPGLPDGDGDAAGGLEPAANGRGDARDATQA